MPVQPEEFYTKKKKKKWIRKAQMNDLQEKSKTKTWTEIRQKDHEKIHIQKVWTDEELIMLTLASPEKKGQDNLPEIHLRLSKKDKTGQVRAPHTEQSCSGQKIYIGHPVSFHL